MYSFNPGRDAAGNARGAESGRLHGKDEESEGGRRRGAGAVGAVSN